MITKQSIFLLTVLSSLFVTKVHAIWFSVENSDGLTLKYQHINSDKEAEVVGVFPFWGGNINIPEEVIYKGKTLKVTSIGAWAFKNLDNLTSITIPSTVTNIRIEAFSGCIKLKSLIIPQGVTSIGDRAFENCYDLKTITIPNSIIFIGKYAFGSCEKLTSATIPQGVESIEDGTFSGCYELKSLTIPNSLTNIGSYAFSCCKSLPSITIPKGVTCINKGTFYACYSIKSMTIPNSVTSIGENAFDGCDGLTSITIPNSVTNIEKEAFSYCFNIKKIISEIGNPFTINENTFTQEVYNKAELHVPKGTKVKYNSLDGWKNFSTIKESLPSNIQINENDETKEHKRYLLDGSIITTHKRGVNIIQMKNGMTKKIIVK